MADPDEPTPPSADVEGGVLVREVATPSGQARAHVRVPPAGAGSDAPVLVLGHGAGGGIGSADLQALLGLAEQGWSVVLVEQPWRVAGRRVAGPPPTLDPPWVAVLADLADLRGPGSRRPLIVGGRSAGARVACRTAGAVSADAVLCLSFPLHPPGRPGRSRADELALSAGAGLPVLVVQGERDPFGTPEQVRASAGAAVGVEAVPGSHTPRVSAPRLRALVTGWADRTLPA